MKLSDEIENTSAFGINTERAIISLILDNPEFFTAAGQHISHKFFKAAESKYIMGIIEILFEESSVVPSRSVVRDYAVQNLTVDSDFEPIIELIDRKSDPREVPFVKRELLQWARDQAFGLLYSDEGMEAYEAGDYTKLEQILDQAKKITDVSDDGLFFFEELELLFVRDLEKRYTCGFPRLDRYINEGGPTKKEVFCWMAGTGIGKSILLPHSGMANVKRGCNVLHISLELSKIKTALRYAGGLTKVEVAKRYESANRKKMMDVLRKAKKSYGGDLIIYEFSPNEISTAHVSQLMDRLRKNHSWHTDILVVDYLELMIAARSEYNRDEYLRQKQVSTELRQLARNEEVLIFTACQTSKEDPRGNKNSTGPNVAGTNKAAESYGKMMPLDYVVSGNQNWDEYNCSQPQIRLFIAKNRNGPKNQIVPAIIDYKTFHMSEKTSKLSKK